MATSNSAREVSSRPSGHIVVVSTLCYICAVILCLISTAIVIPAVSSHGLLSTGAILWLGMFAMGIAYAIAGFAIRRQRMAGSRLARVLAVVSSVLLLGAPVRVVWLPINVVIFALLVINRDSFGTSAERVRSQATVER